MGSSIKITFAAILAGATSLASASVVTLKVDVSASGFYAEFGDNNPAPYQTLVQSFTVTFDPTLSYSEDTKDIIVNSMGGFPIGSKVGFNYRYTNQPGYFLSELSIGGEALGVDALSAGYVDEAFSVFFNSSLVPTSYANAFGYVANIGNSVFSSTAFNATVTAVPEPESPALVLGGLGLMALIARRRKS